MLIKKIYIIIIIIVVVIIDQDKAFIWNKFCNIIPFKAWSQYNSFFLEEGGDYMKLII